MKQFHAPELHPALQADPSPATRQSRLIWKLAEEANDIVQLIEHLKSIEPRLRSDCPDGDVTAHLRACERRDYRAASNLIVNHGVPKAKP